MPKVVDHDERRRQIAAAVADIAATDGLGDVSFRVVAKRAGMSVALVQHYFGDKANLLRTTLELQSEDMNAHIATKLADLGPDAGAGDLLRAVAHAFLPLDETSRRSMLVYHGFAAAALTDDSLRGSEMFTNGRGLVEFFAAQIARLDGVPRQRRDDPEPDAIGLLSLLLGLSTAMLLDQTTPAEAIQVLERHLDHLAGRGR